MVSGDMSIWMYRRLGRSRMEKNTKNLGSCQKQRWKLRFETIVFMSKHKLHIEQQGNTDFLF